MKALTAVVIALAFFGLKMTVAPALATAGYGKGSGKMERKNQKLPLGKTITLIGTAKDAKGGAVLVTAEGEVIYLGGLSQWNDRFFGKEMAVTGVLRDKKLIPDPENKAGAHGAGALGTQLVLDDPSWELRERRPDLEEAPGMPRCIERFAVNKTGSVLAEQRLVGPPAPDFQKRFRAAAIDRKTYLPVKAVETFRVRGRDEALLWFTPDRTEAVLDERVFSDLDVADPTRMRAGERSSIGRISESARDQISGRVLGRFLIECGIIRTFWHLESEVCLERETETEPEYRALYSGKHEYFTSRRHEGSFVFSLVVGADGAIRIEIPEGRKRGFP